jgi:hypothetical protein
MIYYYEMLLRAYYEMIRESSNFLFVWVTYIATFLFTPFLYSPNISIKL